MLKAPAQQVSKAPLNSAIYQGWVRHRRHQPKVHSFCYAVYMMYLDLSELDRVFNGALVWSSCRPALAYFKRSDFLGDANQPLDHAVRARVQALEGVYPTGAIRMLVNLRYFGLNFNPICTYYIFDDNDNVQFIVAEVSNTPWKERHTYVLNCDTNKKKQRLRFDKTFHVSPFNPMNHSYQWYSNRPDKHLNIHMQNWLEDDLIMDATLCLTRREITPASLWSVLLSYPVMTLKVVCSIYYEAIKLAFKKVPFCPHPYRSKKVVS